MFLQNVTAQAITAVLMAMVSINCHMEGPAAAVLTGWTFMSFLSEIDYGREAG